VGLRSGDAAANPPDVLADDPLWPSFRFTATRTRAPARRALHAARSAASPPPTTRTSVVSSVAAVERAVTGARLRPGYFATWSRRGWFVSTSHPVDVTSTVSL